MMSTVTFQFMKKAFYPLLLSIYPILLLYSNNMDTVYFSNTLVPLMISFGGTLVIMSLLYFLLKDFNKAALITLLFLIVFFTYGHLHSAIYKYLVIADINRAGNYDFYKQLVYWILLGIWAVVLTFSIVKIAKTKNIDFIAKTTFPINFMTIVLLSMPTATVIINLVTAKSTVAQINDNIYKDSSNVISTTGYLPDIYYIVLDGYARNDMLQKYYNFDNKVFIEKLNNNGFFVAPKSRSNYFWTQLSLTSSLNMEHILYFADNPGKESTSKERLNLRIRDNEVRKYLQGLGYKYIHLTSTYEITKNNHLADIKIDCSKGAFKNEFYRALAESTLFKLIESSVSHDLAKCHLENMKTLSTLPNNITGPKFVFAHFIPPHHPYLFNRDGKILRHATVSNQFEFQKYLWFDKKKYVDQLIYLNKRFLEIVEDILQYSKNPPIIIIQSDHGPQLLDPKNKRKEHKDFKNARSANFLAVYTPEATGIIPADTTPVNLFRRLFNYYFNADMEILPDDTYYSGFHKPYLFEKWSQEYSRADK